MELTHMSATAFLQQERAREAREKAGRDKAWNAHVDACDKAGTDPEAVKFDYKPEDPAPAVFHYGGNIVVLAKLDGRKVYDPEDVSERVREYALLHRLDKREAANV